MQAYTYGGVAKITDASSFYRVSGGHTGRYSYVAYNSCGVFDHKILSFSKREKY